MTPALRASARHWIFGTLVALGGVALNRVVAPAFSGEARAWFEAAGKLIAFAGLFVLALGIRRRIRAAQADPTD